MKSQVVQIERKIFDRSWEKANLTGQEVDRVNSIEIEVKLFATLRDYLPKGSGRFSCKIKVDGHTRIQDILSKLKIPDEIPKIILVNGIHGKKEQVLKEGDVLSIFPPVAGG